MPVLSKHSASKGLRFEVLAAIVIARSVELDEGDVAISA
jgi:hypothetical protein